MPHIPNGLFSRWPCVLLRIVQVAFRCFIFPAAEVVQKLINYAHLGFRCCRVVPVGPRLAPSNTVLSMTIGLQVQLHSSVPHVFVDGRAFHGYSTDGLGFSYSWFSFSL